jgi:UDP-galactopyranose mutase
MADVGILALVSDDWPVAPQRRHHVLTRLAQRFPVAWISPPLHWRDRSRRGAAPDGRMFILGSASGIRTVRRPRFIHDAIYKRRVMRGLRWLRGRGCKTVELQIWNPAFAPAVDWVAGAVVSYHIDDEYSWSTADVPLSAAERRLIERADRVYVSSPKLLDTKGGINPNTTLSSNGADFAAFSTPARVPADCAAIAAPRVAYVGVIKEQLDIDLLIALASAHALWSFVLVGPVRTVHTSLAEPLRHLASLSNVHMLGERLVETLPGYLQHVDVALLPYRRNAYTDAINPMKLYEALAAGTPVVASRIRTVGSEEFRSVVAVAEGIDGWSNAIAASLGPDARSPRRVAERQAVARAHDWDAIADELARDVGRRP